MRMDWLTGYAYTDERERNMTKNIYTAVMLFLMMVLLIGGVYINSVMEVFTV